MAMAAHVQCNYPKCRCKHKRNASDPHRPTQPDRLADAIKLSHISRFLPFKQSLRSRSGFATHWSTTHTMFCSAVRYGAACTEHKPVVDQPPLCWTADGSNLDLFSESQEPFMAAALRKRRAQLFPHRLSSSLVCVTNAVLPILVLVGLAALIAVAVTAVSVVEFTRVFFASSLPMPTLVVRCLHYWDLWACMPLHGTAEGRR